MRRLARTGGGVAALALAALAAPAVASAHMMQTTFESRLPLAIYLAGAGGAVALSFIFVLVRDIRAEASPAGRLLTLPAWLRGGLRGLGVLGWLWIVVQAVLGGQSNAEVARLFTWVYSWVGVAIISAFVFPIWTWMNPFPTLFDLGARLLGATGMGGAEAADYPAILGRWPAVIGFAGVVWLELIAAGAGSRTLGLVVAGYTVFTLAMMAQYGRDTWLRSGDVFAAWFGLLNRLAPFGRVDGDEVHVRRRGFGTGLLEGGFEFQDVVLIALGTGSILFDGLSQTQVWVDVFGLQPALPQTLLLVGFIGIIVLAAIGVSRLVGVNATGAGLLPIAVGYLIAHYFTYLVIDGQRIVIAISDPLQRGANYFGTAFFEPSSSWLPAGFVWTLQLAAVVGGHMLGAWAGHVVAAGEVERRGEAAVTAVRRRQIPLAAIMVALTTLTLWSLGQALFVQKAG